MPRRNTRVVGADEVFKELQKVQSDIEDGVVESFKKDGKEVVKAVKSVAPKKSGQLKKDIKSAVYEDYGKPIKLKIFIKRRSAFYGFFAEFGTSKQAARPFFFRTILAKYPDIKSNIKNLINARIDRSNARTRGRRAEILKRLSL